MAGIISLIFLFTGVLAFTRKIKLFKFLSSILLYFSFLVAKDSFSLQVFNVSIILLALIIITYINTNKEKRISFTSQYLAGC